MTRNKSFIVLLRTVIFYVIFIGSVSAPMFSEFLAVGIQTQPMTSWANTYSSQYSVIGPEINHRVDAAKNWPFDNNWQNAYVMIILSNMFGSIPSSGYPLSDWYGYPPLLDFNTRQWGIPQTISPDIWPNTIFEPICFGFSLNGYTWPGIFSPYYYSIYPPALGYNLPGIPPPLFMSGMGVIGKSGSTYILWPEDYECPGAYQAITQGVPCYMITGSEFYYNGKEYALYSDFSGRIYFAETHVTEIV